MKFLLGVNKSCTNVAILGETGEYPMMLHALTSVLVFWHRVSNMSDGTLVKQALDIQAQDGPEKSECLGTVELILSILGFSTHYRDTKLIGTVRFASLVKKQLNNHFLERMSLGIIWVRVNLINLGSINYLKRHSKESHILISSQSSI